MKTPAFETLLSEMNEKQRSALISMEAANSDIVWDGGKIDPRPLRVSLKSRNGQNMAAINTRESETFLRLEFRSKDYAGTETFQLDHRSFDRGYDLKDSSAIDVASKIISTIKSIYAK